MKDDQSTFCIIYTIWPCKEILCTKILRRIMSSNGNNFPIEEASKVLFVCLFMVIFWFRPDNFWLTNQPEKCLSTVISVFPQNFVLQVKLTNLSKQRSFLYIQNMHF